MATKFKEFIKSILEKILGIQVTRIQKTPPLDEKPDLKMKFVHDPAYSYMVDKIYQDRLIKELAEIADEFRKRSFLPPNTLESSQNIVEDFFQIYSTRSQTDNTHGSGFHNAFWLYFIARILNPKLIIESGVWKGHTSWLFLNACPNAILHGFDISLNNLEYNDLPAQFHEQDWQTYQFEDFDPDKALIFFDCHINHAQRIIEAKEKGFKHILIDDNPPIHKIFSHVPGIPTAAMLSEGEGIDDGEISWVWNGKLYTEQIDPIEANQAKELIKVHHILPDVGGPTRYGGFTFLTYLQI
jgi:hypothetical protein